MKIDYNIYDGRYLINPDRAICYEAGLKTLKEAMQERSEYGDNTVVVKHTLKQISEREFEVVKSEIVYEENIKQKLTND